MESRQGGAGPADAGMLWIDGVAVTVPTSADYARASPYVLRAVPGAVVSTPLRWKEVTPELDPGRFTLKTIFRRLARQKRDPMAGVAHTKDL